MTPIYYTITIILLSVSICVSAELMLESDIIEALSIARSRRAITNVNKKGPQVLLEPNSSRVQVFEPFITKNDHFRKKPDEQALLDYLMDRYERNVRPVVNASSQVVIKMGLTVAQIFDMDEKNQVLVTVVWLDQEWRDSFMRWEPAEFNYQEMIRIPCKKLWLPDIVLYNNAAEYTDGQMEAHAMVDYTGNVFWPVPTKLQSSCKIDVTYFPFDSQVCLLKFGSWTYDGFQVDITKRTDEPDLSNYVVNGEWELLRIKPKRNVVHYSCCIEPYPDVTFYIHIRRRTLYYMYNVIFPCTMMSALAVLVFCLPPESGEKVALGVTVLLAFSVFMLSVNENLPETSEFVPLIGIYLTIVMALTSLSVIMTVFVLNLHHRGPNLRPVPPKLQKFVLKYIGELVCVRLPMTPMPDEANLIYEGITVKAQRGSYVSPGLTMDELTTELRDELSPLNRRGVTKQPRGSQRYAQRTADYASFDFYQQSASLTTSPLPQYRTARTGYSHFNRNANMVSPRSWVLPSGRTRESNLYPRVQQYTYQNGAASSPNVAPFFKPPTPDSPFKSAFNDPSDLDLLNALKKIAQRHDEMDIKDLVVTEWQKLAVVLDRLLFWIFMVITIGTTTGILIIMPLQQTDIMKDIDFTEHTMHA